MKMLAFHLAKNLNETTCRTFFFSGFHVISCLANIISFLLETLWWLLGHSRSTDRISSQLSWPGHSMKTLQHQCCRRTAERGVGRSFSAAATDDCWRNRGYVDVDKMSHKSVHLWKLLPCWETTYVRGWHRSSPKPAAVAGSMLSTGKQGAFRFWKYRQGVCQL